MIPGQHFDALLFVENTMSARPNNPKRSTPNAGSPTQQNSQSLTNADFEEADRDGKPATWTAITGTGKGSYVVATVESQPFHGKRCVSITRDSAPWRWGYGALSQSVDATAYRGKRIRFRAATRAEVLGVGNKSGLFVKVLAPSARGQTNALSVASTLDQPPHFTDWQFHQVETDVPPEANSITIGLVLTGNGRAWFDDASLQVIGEPQALP
jgi:erythromycin esterase